MQKILVWLRRDLRLKDNPALYAAAQEGQVLPLYVFDGRLGAAQHAWVCHTIAALREEGFPVVVRKGKPSAVIPKMVKEHKIDAVFANRVYDPVGRREEKLCDETFNGSLLIEPWEVQNKQGKEFKVFTPFWRTAKGQIEKRELLPAPKLDVVRAVKGKVALPKHPMTAHWEFGEQAARRRLKQFVNSGLAKYGRQRDRLDLDGTSRLSPYLATGQLSPQQVWELTKRNTTFAAELGWREFSYHLLYHFPKLETEPFRPEFSRFPWKWRGKGVAAWQQGRTGYPVVDAAMHQLPAAGWMHNRARMIVASFLTKDLLIHWRVGAAWFWEHLVDADPANNAASWQWTAGCGADAAPFFRVFNPITQGEKFDPTGDYVEEWCPEEVAPIVDHGEAREAALKLYKRL